jgi:hypothetical protein
MQVMKERSRAKDEINYLMATVEKMVQAGGNVSIIQKSGCAICEAPINGNYCRKCHEETTPIRLVNVTTKMLFPFRG